ncbi:MAG: hypothetical protein K2Y32_21925 [Candidatus Obscuribacterales bacterium]|nr:hypothetical protein [Candidatus Obscuribacterales bacterium]
MSTCFLSQTNGSTASLVSPEQKARIQALLAKMCRATLAQSLQENYQEVDNADESPVYAWFPAAEVMVEKPPVEIQEPPLLEEAQLVSMPESGPLLKHLAKTVLEHSPLSPVVKLERVAARKLQAGDIAIMKDGEGKFYNAVAAMAQDGKLYLHARMSWGWQKRSLEQASQEKSLISAYRLALH